MELFYSIFAVFLVFSAKFAQFLSFGKHYNFKINHPQPSFRNMSGLYIHIPFCKSKCAYCAFFSKRPVGAELDNFVDALLNETRIRRHEMRENPRTIYIGGGTPSLLSPTLFKRLAEGLKDIFPNARPEEFTIEANPDDISEELAMCWRENGVNRVSVGVQSFVDPELTAISRRHDSAGAVKAIETVKRYFDNYSIDLMFGLPMQTPQSWEFSLRKALSLNPKHISAYSLTIEEKTRLMSLLKVGKFSETDENISAEMFHTLIETLSAAGFNHYELSNFALPGFHSRHNSSYWDSTPYIGIGPSASSYDGARRRSMNIADIKAYSHSLSERGELPPHEEEFLSDYDLKVEYIMTRLRTSRGIDMRDYAGRFGKGEAETLARKAASAINSGNATMENDMLRLTRQGLFISDDITLLLLPDS